MTKAAETGAAQQDSFQIVAQRHSVMPAVSERGTSVAVINRNHVVIEVVTHAAAVAAARKKTKNNLCFVISVDFSSGF